MTAARSLRAELVNLRDSLAPLRGQGVGTFHPVRVRPSLGFALVPRPREREDRDADRPRLLPGPRPRRSEIGRLCRLMAAAADAPPPAALGLVEGGESDASAQQPRRNGLHGLTGRGALFLEDFCSAIREDRYCYGMWTVTLPVEVAQVLDATPDGIQRLGDVIRRRFGEALRRACAKESQRRGVPVPDHFAYVAEPQKAGRIHWHYVFRCKSSRGARWLLGKGQLDRLIRAAFRTVTGTTYPVVAAGNVQALRSSPGAYLSKYLRKGHGVTGADAVLGKGWSLNMVPKQWWGASRSALGLVRSLIWELPRIAVNWLSREWPALVRVGALEASIWQPEADGAPAIVCGRWRSIDHLAGLLDHLLLLAEHPCPA